MKKILVILLAAAMSLSLLGACSSGNNNTAQSATQAPAQTAVQTENQTPAQTTALKKITFVLDWTPNTNHTGIYVAKDKGYFAQDGLDVDIIQPSQDSVDQLVAAGTAQFGIDFQDSMTFARDQGLPVVSIAAILQHNTSALASPEDRNITRPKDFEGKRYGSAGGEAEAATLKYLMQQDSGDFSKLTIIDIGETDVIDAEQQGSIDIGWIYQGWEGISAQLKGIDLNEIPFSNTPVFDYYTPVIVTSEDMINNQKDTVAAFMDAVKKGYDYAVQNPKESADILLKNAPELDPQLVYASQNYLSPKYIDDAPSFGIQKAEVWDRYTKWLYDNGFIKKLMDSSSAFTNEFVQ